MLILSSCQHEPNPVPTPAANGGLLRGSLIKKVIQFHQETKKLPASIEDLEHQGLFPYSFSYGTKGGRTTVDRSVLTKFELKILPKGARNVISVTYVIGGESFNDEYEEGKLE